MTTTVRAKNDVSKIVRLALAGDRNVERVIEDPQHPNEIVLLYKKGPDLVRLKVRVSIAA